MWHRWIGISLVLVGVGVAVLNDAQLFMENETLLPFGHQELWLFTGFALVAGGAWFFGVMDPSPRVRRRPR